MIFTNFSHTPATGFRYLFKLLLLLLAVLLCIKDPALSQQLAKAVLAEALDDEIAKIGPHVDNFIGEWRIIPEGNSGPLNFKVIRFYGKDKFSIEDSGGADVYANGHTSRRINNLRLEASYKLNKKLDGNQDIKDLLGDFGTIEFYMNDDIKYAFALLRHEGYGSYMITLERISSLARARLHFKVRTTGAKIIKPGSSFIVTAIVTNLGPGPVPARGTTVYIYLEDAGAQIEALENTRMNCYKLDPAALDVWCEVEPLVGASKVSSAKAKVRVTLPENFSGNNISGYVVSEAVPVMGAQEQTMKAKAFKKKVAAAKDRLALQGLWRVRNTSTPLFVRFSGSDGVMVQGAAITECGIGPGTTIYRNLTRQGSSYNYTGEQLGCITSTGTRSWSSTYFELKKKAYLQNNFRTWVKVRN